ncbi:MAG: phosphatase PAP2 family protein [Paludibacteraceae bacterium]
MHPGKRFRLYSVEKLTLIYIFITFLIGLYFLFVNHYRVQSLLYFRILISASILGLAYLTSRTKSRHIIFLRFFLIGGLLAYWYPETFEFNRFLENQDSLVAHWEQSIFGFQPAYLFNHYFPQRIISELMNLGYFSYFPLIIFTCAHFYFYDKKFFHPFFFNVMFAFLLFYLIFILFPVVGPQYYYAVIGGKNVAADLFPAIGNFFSTHSIEPLKETTGFFDFLVNSVQKVGERPTAAFPSSHVGISTLIMYMLSGHKKYLLFFCLLPFYLFLIASTVYIQAHYTIDIFAGFIAAFIFYYLGKYAFKALS